MEAVRLLFALRGRNRLSHRVRLVLIWGHQPSINTAPMTPSTLVVSPPAPSPSSPSHFQSPAMSRREKPKINTSQLHNRILELMAHTTRYAFQGETRLAHDAGVSKSAVCRLLSGKSSPSFALVSAITRALEKQLGRPLDPRDLISLDGSYPTASACELAGCRGCLPPEAYDEHDQLKPEYKNVKPGQWCVAPRSSVVSKDKEAR